MSSPLPRLTATPDLVEQVYQRLVDAINTGRLEPGARLTQESVAEQLAVSRQPVLQALRQLRADGLVRDAVGPQGQKGRGVVVAPLDTLQIVHVYEVRSALDALAARLAARHRVALDSALIEEGRRTAASQDIAAMIDADMAFHRAIYQASGNPLIESSALLHWGHIRRAMGLALRNSRLREPVWDEHAAMALLIVQGDEEGAAQLMAHHGQQASSHLVQQLGGLSKLSTPANSSVDQLPPSLDPIF